MAVVETAVAVMGEVREGEKAVEEMAVEKEVETVAVAREEETAVGGWRWRRRWWRRWWRRRRWW